MWAISGASSPPPRTTTSTTSSKREFNGHEIGGIKLHAAIDVEIRHNRIHDTTLGTWLDWQTQGTRVTRNLSYANNRDIFIEVSHGPYIVDHNVIASPASLEVFSQGGAYVNNLIAGTVDAEFEERDGTPAEIDIDLRGDQKSIDRVYPVGPLSVVTSGVDRGRVW